MTEPKNERENVVRSVTGAVECPAWCRGCGPNDPMHRGFLATVGQERTGWVSVQMLLDRFARRELVVKLDATRNGATQPVLLDRIRLDRLIYELTYARLVMMTKGQYLEEHDEHP
ncbi:hypothetical protein [Micromonospora tulbaghiae]|nr:hypothetical protein [Micromonospora tulbaghiae]